MKKTNKLLVILINIILVIWININITNAVKITTNIHLTDEITWEEAINFYTIFFNDEIPDSYKYIKLNFKWIENDSITYDSLQKLVYFDLVNNSYTKINDKNKITWYEFYKLIDKIFEINLINDKNEEKLKKRNANINDLIITKNLINKEYTKIDNFVKNNEKTDIKKEIFSDVYSIILNEHYNKQNITEDQIITKAIEWLASWTKDKHTVYFPPTETQNFYESLNWEYEWIWSYVEAEKPWLIKIVSPIKNSPAEKAWLKWWDIIIKVDWKEVNEKNSLQEVVSWIKWPNWTSVILTIKRDNKTFDVEVIRAKIIIKDVEFEKISYNTFYIEIKSFWENVSENFEEALVALHKEKNIKKVIIDLRSNWWGYLWEVSDMLSYFVKKWDNTAILKYLDSEKTYKSKWYELIDFNNYKIVILQNSWTASASEIMIGTIKDYYPDSTIIWEQSYGKGSVQTVKSYKDWSTFKYTIAKWFTWKNQIWIDWIWITPDINLELNIENYNKYKIDNQLEKAKTIK